MTTGPIAVAKNFVSLLLNADSGFEMRLRSALRALPQSLSLTLVASIMIGCQNGDDASSDGGGGSQGEGQELIEDWQLEEHPHLIDSYLTSGATRTIVFLHGGGGTKEEFASALGLRRGSDTNVEEIDWLWLRQNRTNAIFPQGQALTATPGATTWSNYVMDSGQDDEEFLLDLSATLRKELEGTSLYVVGHSNGGMMINRLWCEGFDNFDAYVSFAGPPSADYGDGTRTCSPRGEPSYFAVVGDADAVLQTSSDTFEDETWQISPTLVNASPEAFLSPLLFGEVASQARRAEEACGGTPESVEAPPGVDSASVQVTRACDHLTLMQVEGGGHPLSSIEQQTGIRTLDLVVEFLDSL